MREAHAVAVSVGWPKPQANPGNTEAVTLFTVDRVLGVPAATIRPRLDAVIERFQTTGYHAMALRARMERGLLELREKHTAEALTELRAVRDEAQRLGLLAIMARASQLLGRR